VWWSRRAEQLWLRRVEVQGPTAWVDAERLLSRGGSAALAVRVGVGGSSLQIMLTAFLDERLSTLRWWLEEHERPKLLPDSVVRLGVRYSDGQTATNLPGAYWTAREEGPVFVTQSQADPPEELHALEGAVALQWEVWPAPASGELTVACAWPYADVPEQRVVFDETEMAAVIERSRRTAVTRRPRPAQAAPPPPAVLRTPVRWDVTVWLTPAELLQGARHDWDAQVAAIAGAAHADDWTSDFVDDFLREYEVPGEPRRRATSSDGSDASRAPTN